MLVRLYGTHESKTKPRLIVKDQTCPAYVRKTYISESRKHFSQKVPENGLDSGACGQVLLPDMLQ
jgi:hypothetical protein